MDSVNNTPKVLKNRNVDNLENQNFSFENTNNNNNEKSNEIENNNNSFNFINDTPPYIQNIQNESNNFSSEYFQLKNEIKNLENIFSLHSLPQFSDLFNYLLDNSNYDKNSINPLNSLNLLKVSINNFYKLIQIKSEDNQKKVYYLERLQKNDYEKQNLEKELNRYKINNNEITEKLKKLSIQFEDKKKESEEEIKKYKNELIEKSSEINKWRTKYNKLQHESNKNLTLIDKQNETIMKRLVNMEKGGSTSKEFKFMNSNPGKQELNMSYSIYSNNTSSQNFGSFNNNFNKENNINITTVIIPKEKFQKELQRTLDDKFSHINKENELLKKFLIELNIKFVNLVNIKKISFLESYKKTFGFDFPNNENITLDAEFNYISNLNPNLNLTLELDSFFTIFNNNFIKIEEYLARSEELNFINNFDFESNFNENNNITSASKNFKQIKNSYTDKDSFLNEKYITNFITLFDKYKILNSSLISIFDNNLKLKQIRQDNIIEEVVSRFSNNVEDRNMSRENLYLDNIKEILKDNNNILTNFNEDNFIKKVKFENSDKNNIEIFSKFNKDLNEEIINYERILDATLNYCDSINNK